MFAFLSLRPTFDIDLHDAKSVVMSRLESHKANLPADSLYMIFGEYGELHLPAGEHRLWSPYLTFYVAERESGARIHGRFTPRLDVWTSVWIAYLALAFSAFFGAIIAYSQWFVGEPTWGIWITIVGIVGIVGLYLIASIGQQWSDDQMRALRGRLDEILRDTQLV